MNIEISQIYWIYDYIWIYVYLNKIYFLLETMISYDFWTNWLWINSDTQTSGGYLLVLWYPTNGGRSLVLWYPNQWGSFIGILIPKPMGVVHWYSDTQTNGGCSLVCWYPNQGDLFIDTLMPSHGDIAWP